MTHFHIVHKDYDSFPLCLILFQTTVFIIHWLLITESLCSVCPPGVDKVLIIYTIYIILHYIITLFFIIKGRSAHHQVSNCSSIISYMH